MELRVLSEGRDLSHHVMYDTRVAPRFAPRKKILSHTGYTGGASTQFHGLLSKFIGVAPLF